MKPELSYLAHNLVEIDKYRVETCCVIGKWRANLITINTQFTNCSQLVIKLLVVEYVKSILHCHEWMACYSFTGV